jgi:hypothetical protein
MTHQNQTAAAFNIADFEASDTAWLDVQNKRDDGPLIGANGKPVRIEIRSPGSKEALHAQHKIEQAATAKTFAGMRGKVVKETVEGNLAERAAKLAAVTASIENFPISPIDLYCNPQLGYITAQVAAFHGDWANF